MGRCLFNIFTTTVKGGRTRGDKKGGGRGGGGNVLTAWIGWEALYQTGKSLNLVAKYRTQREKIR